MQIMKKKLVLILAIAILPIIVNAKNQTFDEFWKDIQKTKGDKNLLIQHCTDYLQDNEFKITKEEFISVEIAMNTFSKWIPKLTKGNKYSARLKETTKTLKDNSSTEIIFYKYGTGTNFTNESNFYVLRITNRTSILENDEWNDKNYDLEFCFALRGGKFKIVGYAHRTK